MQYKIIFIIIYMLQLLFYPSLSWAQFYQKADYGDASVTRKNQLGGYDYYDKGGNIVGYSEKTHEGDYIYYDVDGNKLGALKKDEDEETYTYYGADDIPTGSFRKTPTGEYRYTDKLEGGIRGVTPPPGEDIGFYPPSSYLEGTFKPQLEGGFKKEKEE